jgi:sulfatase maturation enzyme AslB (radical SAM superfamily)
MVRHDLVLDLVEQANTVPTGGTFTVEVSPDHRDASRETLEAWCERTGNELVEIAGSHARVRRGRASDPLAGLTPDQLPGTRLWMYTNFDCNLACDYCCVRSSPQTDRRALGIDNVRRLASEAVDAGVSELILTGGEPFLLPDLDEVVEVCTSRLPTTLLTNGMLFKGMRLERLRRMDRERLTLQISVDSPTPEVHDSHRGKRSWERAIDGIRIAHEEGFRVKVAATLPAEQVHELEPFHDFLDSIGIARYDQVIRALAHRGVSESGIELTVESLIPEVTITADGVYWHPIAADHEDQLVSRQIFPLKVAIDEVRARFIEHRRRAEAVAAWFPCA